MATNIDKFRGLLQELFQLDQAELDFGIYRIMNQSGMKSSVSGQGFIAPGEDGVQAVQVCG